MNEYLIRTGSPEDYPPGMYRSVVRTGQIAGDTVLDILHTSDPTIPGDVLIGGWARDGSKVEPFNQTQYEAIRPLGNLPEQPIYDDDGNEVGSIPAGVATQDLEYHHYAGWSQRNLGDDASEDRIARHYPATNAPFAIEVRHKWFGGNPNPAWDSWGWRAEFIGGSDSRDPSARAIGIYHDPLWQSYWYTTGAFVEQPSDWQTDGQGDPLAVWATEYNPGLLGAPEPFPAPVHHAVLLGAAKEGTQTLESDEAADIHLYWENTQS